MGDAGTKLRKVAQFLLRQLDLSKERIAENLVELGKRAVVFARREVAQVEIVSFRHAQQDLRADRPLVALDKIDVARRDAEAVRHLRLREPELPADSPKTWADEELASRFCHL